MPAWTATTVKRYGFVACRLQRVSTPSFGALKSRQLPSCSLRKSEQSPLKALIRLQSRGSWCSYARRDICRSTSAQQQVQPPVDPVVSTAWLAAHLKDVTILDVRGRVKTKLHSKTANGTRLEMSEYLSDYDIYLEGHIPGAIFIDWTQDGIDQDASDTPVQLQTDSAIFAAEMQAKGISTDRPVVVQTIPTFLSAGYAGLSIACCMHPILAALIRIAPVYDSGNGLLAPRIWWSLAYHGHPAPLVLDGGYAKWMEEGRPAELAEPCPIGLSPDMRQWHQGCSSPTDGAPASQPDAGRTAKGNYIFTAKSQPHRRAVVEDMLQAMKDQESGKAIILDARSQGQFTGEIRRAEHGGHIPGAVNLTRKALRDDKTGLLKPLHEQRQMFEAAGVDCSGNGSQQIFTYCNGGVASCSLMLALDQLGLGKHSANYDGSWNEWGNDLQLPVESSY